MGEQFPSYILWIFPVLYFGFIAALIAWALLRPRRSRRDGVPSGRRRGRPAPRSDSDDLWLASYLSELHREQYHGRR